MNPEQQLVLVNLSLLFLLKLACFTFGFLIVRIGAQLLREGIKGEFKFRSSVAGAKADLVSASPGLLFLLLGVILIGYAMGIPKSIEYEHDSKPDPTPKGEPLLPPMPSEKKT